MAQTTAGQQRCTASGNENQLFVVDWDATDASRFEARAQRDVVVVKLSGCELTVLDGCFDSSVAGRLGSYRAPVETSGSLESFAIRDQSELSAKLPLGVAELGGEISSDRGLLLKYFVAATRESTRGALYADELGNIPACAGATHFVSRYNLGAFELDSDDVSKVAASASAPAIGSASGSRATSAKTVRRAGDLKNCTEFNKHRCRVPIRLSLTQLTAGAPPAGPSTTTTAGPGGFGTFAKLELSAGQKLSLGDGIGCLRALDGADRLDTGGRLRRLELRARCEMRAGKCDDGKKHYREARVAFHKQHDATGLVTDATIDQEVARMAERTCPTKGQRASTSQLTIAATQKILIASQTGDLKTCIREGEQLAKLPPAAEPVVRNTMSAAIRKASECAAKAKQCDVAKRLWRRHYKLFLSNSATDADADRAFKTNVPGC